MFRVNPESIDATLWNQYKGAWEVANTAAKNQDNSTFVVFFGKFIKAGTDMAQKYHEHGLKDDETKMWSHINTHKDMLLELMGYDVIRQKAKEEEPEEVDVDMSDEEAMYNATHRWED
jgi:hypothetical protein